MIKLYMSKGRLLFVALSLLLSLQSFAQRSVSGKVLDADGVELIGASVLAKGTTSGTITGVDGGFQLNVPDGVNTLVISYTGYNSMEVDITGKDVIDVVLAVDDGILEEVVVIGYGRQKKSLVTGSISSIAVEDIQSLSNGQLQSALQGRTAGVTILPNSGSPGAGFKVRVRGTGSNGNSEPLYIVDGMRTSDISFLSNNEVESIEVLKDAASAAIYGVEGANGVVIITTKKGSEKSAGITYDLQVGQQSYNGNLELMNAAQHAEYMTESGIAGREDYNGPSTNWLDEVFESAALQRHTLSFNGGNKDLNYFLQGSYLDQDGIVVGDRDNFKRYGVRANIENNVNSWLRIGANINYSHNQRRGIDEDNEFGGVLANSILMDPATPVTYGSDLPEFVQGFVDEDRDLLRDENGNIYGLSNFVGGEIYNPVAAIGLTNGTGLNIDRVLGSAYGEISLMEGLKLTSRIGVDNTTGNFHNWTPSFYFTDTRQAGDATVVQNHWRNFNYQWENFATYDVTMGNSNLSFVLGTSMYDQQTTFVNAAGTGLVRERETFGYLNSVNLDKTTSRGGIAREKLLSYFGRASYDYGGKYLLSASLRRDGSSLLADGSKWGVFPAVAVGWVLSKEDFFGEGGLVNFAKLRASWGQNGSLSNIGQGAWKGAIVTNGLYPNANGELLTTGSPNILTNTELTWEKSEQIDIGIDLGFLDDKITFTADVFDKQTKDLLNGGVIPALVGAPAPVVNLGTISNRGLELELGHKNNLGKLSYNVSANFTALRNVVTELDENLDFAPGTGVGVGWTATGFQEGRPAWYFRGYETDGILANTADANAYATEMNLLDADGNPTVQAGDPRVVDVNGDGTITPDDQTFIGSPHPDFIYGFRFGLDYGRFDFAAFLQGVAGNDILLGYNRTDRATANKPAFFYEDRWTEDNPNASLFRANSDNVYAYNGDLMIFDGSYARVKQIQLGLNFTQDDLKFTRGGRLYLSLDDILTFTGYQGLDPEVGSSRDNSLGIDRGVYPLPRKFLVGLTLSL